VVCDGLVESVAVHILVDLFGVDPALLDSVSSLEAALMDAVQAAQCTPLEVVSHKFQPQGASVVVLVAESHLSIHTWPEHRYAAVDIFTCGGALPMHGIAPILRALRPASHRVQEIPRGPQVSTGGSGTA
jgi:S-adenosylmethionine decarboxylase